MQVVCIDDEYLILEYIERQFKKIDAVEVIGTFTNPLEGKEFILAHEVDAVFLDIQMTPINGIELAEQILQEKPDLQVIFITAFESFAVQAFELNALDYLVKPVRLERLQQAVKRVRKTIEAAQREASVSPANLRIKVATGLTFEIAPGKFEALQWRTSKAQELFIYLLQNNGVIVEKSSIIELLWEEYELDKAYSLLYTTIYNTRKQLKKLNNYLVLHNHSHGYLLEFRNVEVDLYCWEKEIKQLGPVTSSNLQAYEKKMNLYTGDYLTRYDFTWLEPKREYLKLLWVRSAKSLAAFYIEEGKLSEAIRWYSEIVERYPTFEEVHFNLMKLYIENGEFTLMMQQYNLLHRICREYFDSKPDQEIIDWYLSKLS